MTTMLKTSRRGFLAGSAAAAGGFMLGFHIPFTAAEAAPPVVTGGAAPELNAWVVVKPDETLVIRVARGRRRRPRGGVRGGYEKNYSTPPPPPPPRRGGAGHADRLGPACRRGT